MEPNYTVHGAVVVNSSSDATYNGFEAREVILTARHTAWSNGTTDTATIQFSLTRIRPDGSEDNVVKGPIIVDLSATTIRLQLESGDTVKVSWVIAGGTTSYPTMTTTLSGARPQSAGIALDTFSRALVTITEPTYLMLGDNFHAQQLNYWFEQKTGANEAISYANSYLQMNWTAAAANTFNSVRSRRIATGAGHRFSMETQVLFGDGTSSTTDPANLRRKVGLFDAGNTTYAGFASGFGFMSKGDGSLYAIVENGSSRTVETSLGALSTQHVLLKVVFDDFQAAWYVNDMSVPALRLERNSLSASTSWPRAVYRAVFAQASNTGLSVIPKLSVFFCRVRTSNPELQFGKKQIVGRYRGATALITGSASAQNLLGISNDDTLDKQVFVQRLRVMGANSVASTTPFYYRIVETGAQSAGTTQTSVKMRPDDPTSIATIRSGPTATPTGGDLWVGNPGLTITAVGTTNPVELVCFADESADSDMILLPGEALVCRAEANTTNWRHSAVIFWTEGYL